MFALNGSQEPYLAQYLYSHHKHAYFVVLFKTLTIKTGMHILYLYYILYPWIHFAQFVKECCSSCEEGVERKESAIVSVFCFYSSVKVKKLHNSLTETIC